jgi:hypothetical protein
MEKAIQDIFVQEIFGPLVGVKTIRYRGYWIDATQFVRIHDDGRKELRTLTYFGSQCLNYNYEK